MRHFYKFAVLLSLVIAAINAEAQEFGGNPPSIQWRQVNTPVARVIFPKGLDSMAIRVADIIGQMNRLVQPTIGYSQKQVSIVLQNQTTISNGYVELAPFRSEFFLTPDQNSFELGSLRWTDQLAVHEFRHVQQFNNFDVGLTRVLHVIFGEGGEEVGQGLSIPNWFSEGDAVFNETYVTPQGRGRLPYFFNEYRALWAAGKDYSYMKLRNGSYVDYVPDHYPLGYMLVSYGRQKYGDDFWKKVTHDAASFDGLFYPLQTGVKKYSGLSFKDFRDNALGYYKQQFGLTAPLVSGYSKHQHFIADEEYPAYADDNTIIYTKTTYDHAPVFVARTGNTERVIAQRDFSLDSYMDYHDGKVIYTSYRPDLRWGYRDYTEISIVDVQSGVQTTITHDSKYFSPSFSADGKRIVAVQVTPDGYNELHILDLTGKVLTVIPNKKKLFYTYPKFYGNIIITAVRLPDGKMTIASIDLNGKADYLLAPTINPIAFPSVHHDKVYFSATEGKSDGLFALSLTDKKLYRLQSDTIANDIGNYEVTAFGGKLAWVSFTAYGYRLHQADSSKLQWQLVNGNAVPGGLPDFGITALKKGEAADLLPAVADTQQTVTKYHKAFRLINFHTLQPIFSDPNYTFALQGENVLNTLQTQLLYNYNRNEGYSEFGFSTVYGALFPYLSGGVDYIINRETYSSTGPVYYNQAQYYAGIEFPLNFTSGHHSTGLSFGTDLAYSSNYFSGVYDNPQNNRELVYLNNYVAFSNSTRSAQKNIYPLLAQNITIDYKTAVNGPNAYQFLAEGDFYFPGLFVNHSLVISGAFQQRDQVNYANFSNDFPFPYGYTAENLYQMESVSAHYHFPILYPDKGVANAVYISRIRGDVFYQYGHGYDPYTYNINIDNDFNTVGGTLYLDGQLWNEFPYAVGIRYSRLLDRDIFGGYGPNRIEIVLPISLSTGNTVNGKVHLPDQ